MSRLHRISDPEPSAPRADVVFVHGLGGDAFATWRHGEDAATSWPHWLAQEFPEVGVWSLGYAASPSKWPRFLSLFSKRDRDAGQGMSLPDRGLQVLDQLVQAGLGQRPLFFICHSLGGLVVKQILRKAADAEGSPKRDVATNTRAVLFLATPHAGATLASMASTFRTVFGTTASLEDLRAHDSHLRDLFDWYRHHSANLGIVTAAYYEMRGVADVVPIVNPTSAHPGVGADPVPLDEDHLSIAKPRDREAQVCGAARALLRSHVLPLRPVQATERAASVVPTTSPQRVIVQLEPGTVFQGRTERIPWELPPRAEEFFGRREELEWLVARLAAGKNATVVGPAGLGKTALAAEAVQAVLGDGREDRATSPFPDGVVLLDLYTFRGAAESAWHHLANALAGPDFLAQQPARDRAVEACRARRVLVILEGGEEADGLEGRTTLSTLLGVLSIENRRLLLTRDRTQSVAAESVELQDALKPEEAAALLDALTFGRVSEAVKTRVLALVEGHPLALTWAGGLLARDDDEPEHLARSWAAEGLPRLSDPLRAEHTLEWLFRRSARGLTETARAFLDAAGLLARAPFPLAAMIASKGEPPLGEEAARDALKSLVQRGLLRRARESGHWEFTHVLGYQFARKEHGSAPPQREALARWSIEHLEALISGRPDLAEALSLQRALEHGAALLRADDDQRLWQPLAIGLLYEVADRLEALGQLALEKFALGEVESWLGRFPPTKAQQPFWLRERSVVLNRQGDVLRAQGDLSGAQAEYGESLSLIRHLAESDPSNADWQRDLSVSHNKVGDVLSAQGDLSGAQAAYGELLSLSRRLAESDPSNADWQRDLSVSHDRLGDVLSAQGDLSGAQAAYGESLSLIRRLAKSDPSNAVWQRDLSVSHEKIGGVLRAQGDLSGAQSAYGESLSLRRRLAESDPSNAGWQRDLSVSQEKIGDMLSAQGDLLGAQSAYGESLSLSRRLAESDPSNAVWQRDLSVSLNKRGDVLSAQGDLAGAQAAYGESLSLRRRLAESDPSNAVWQRDLSVSLMRWALSHEQQGNRTESLPFAEESLAIGERLAALDPSNVTWQNDVRFSRAHVARLSARD